MTTSTAHFSGNGDSIVKDIQIHEQNGWSVQSITPTNTTGFVGERGMELRSAIVVFTK